VLRISVEESEAIVRIRLDGKLAGAWVGELERTWSGLKFSRHERPVELDLRQVTSVDDAGRYLLALLEKDGVALVTGSGLLAALVRRNVGLVAGLLLAISGAFAQTVQIRPAERAQVPLLIDSNSAVFWYHGQLRIFSSAGDPMINFVNPETNILQTFPVRVDRNDHFPMWIESVWQDPDGALYAWYHHERLQVCPGQNLTAPEIGAMVSYDGGESFRDLGIVLSSGEPADCSAQNGYFASGHGDFSVIVDRGQGYFYFLFSAYGGDVSSQGIGIARMPFDSRNSPVGAVTKYFDGAWAEPGLGGRLTPVLPAAAAWQRADTDAFWGPSVHWNTHIERFVVLLNRSCCRPGWPQEGIYLTMNADLANPAGWTAPQKLVEGGDWYPWVMGLNPGETSSEAGQLARLFIRHSSEWELVFHREGEQPPPELPE
jgi:hypothetical protein